MHFRDVFVSTLSAASYRAAPMSVMGWKPTMPPEPLMLYPRIVTVLKSRRSNASNFFRGAEIQ